MTDWYEFPCNREADERPKSFTLSVECSNDAFTPYWYVEVARQLRELSAALLEGESIPKKLRDRNGNTVGSVSIN